MHVRGEPPLGFDGAEVLNLVAKVAPQILDESVEQGREMDRVPGSASVVIGGRVDRGAVIEDAAIAVARQRKEHGWAVFRAIAGDVDLAGRASRYRPSGQVRGVLAAPGGPDAAGLRPGVISFAGRAAERAADAGAGELVIELGDRLVQVGGVLAVSFGLVPKDLGAGAQAEPELLVLIRRRGVIRWFVLEVPAVAALLGPQALTRLAHAGQTASKVAPHGIKMWVTSSVSRFVRRSCTGRMQPPRSCVT
jgi:hypothetical protein